MAKAMSNFMKKVYNSGFAPEFSVSMLKKTSRQSEIMYMKLGNEKQN